MGVKEGYFDLAAHRERCSRCNKKTVQEDGFCASCGFREFIFV